MAPRNAYLELDAQPARITPYTPSEVIASRYSRPTLALDNTNWPSNGITDQAANDGARVSSGAMMNIALCALAGSTSSLNSSLKT